MVNVEELDPDPFIELLNNIGLPTETIKTSYSKRKPFKPKEIKKI
jgi:saccharopine dehydrogenase-like NADP-dependent oxidoreductase